MGQSGPRRWKRGPRYPLNLSLETRPLAYTFLFISFVLLGTYQAIPVSWCGDAHSFDRDRTILPTLMHGSALADLAPMLFIGESEQRLNGAEVDEVEQLRGSLVALRRNQGILRPNDPFTGEILVAADLKVPYRRVRAVLREAAEAGYVSVSFLGADPIPNVYGALSNIDPLPAR